LTHPLEELTELNEYGKLERALSGEFRRQDADRYRKLVRRGSDPDRAIRFLRQMVSANPLSADARIQLALALIDRTPDRSLGTMERERLAGEALASIEPITRAQPRAWGVHYLAGLIHLNGFVPRDQAVQAVQAFNRCLQLGGGPHRALAFQAIGDALVKNRRFPMGRKQWKAGQKEFPLDRGLKERMGCTSLMVEAYIDRIRTWEAVQDTDLLSAVVGDLPDLTDGAEPPGKTGKGGQQ